MREIPLRRINLLVIDAKRYAATGKRNNNLTDTHICDIIEEKVNVSRFEKEIVDWIRIDDLPNHPLDIETIRTQPANEEWQKAKQHFEKSLLDNMK